MKFDGSSIERVPSIPEIHNESQKAAKMLLIIAPSVCLGIIVIVYVFGLKVTWGAIAVLLTVMVVGPLFTYLLKKRRTVHILPNSCELYEYRFYRSSRPAAEFYWNAVEQHWIEPGGDFPDVFYVRVSGRDIKLFESSHYGDKVFTKFANRALAKIKGQ